MVLVIGVNSAFECSNRENILSCLEGLLLISAPFARTLSRVWRVYYRPLLTIPSNVYTFTSCGLVAQWIERLPPEQKVVGSNPIKPTL